MGRKKNLLTKDEIMDIGLNLIEMHKQRISELEAELRQSRRWAALWKAKAKELWRENKKLAEFKEQQCSTCDKYWGCKWAYHLDGCSEWESRWDHRNE